jgi:hypothetical protein
MKANRLVTTVLCSAALGALLLAGCSSAPRPAPPPLPAPVIRSSPQPAPVRPAADWRDVAITPGTWTWGMAGPKSVARFGTPGAAPLLSLTCEKAAGEVQLARAGTAAVPVAMAITTTTGTRQLVSEPAASPAGWVTTRIKQRDGVLDAMAFSRGRFAVDVAGLPTLYLPSWPEVSRVIEDCR